MTEDKRAMLCEIGKRVAGPRHVLVLLADRRVLELVSSLTEAGLAESTIFVNREDSEEMLRVCLTGKGWIRYRGGAG
ncbi:MAG: hypothetical protein OXQ84_04075 [bacterium]|nr:hypothetical protein [bacterium]